MACDAPGARLMPALDVHSMARKDRPRLMDRAHWRVSGVRDLPAFLRALPTLLPSGSTLRLELDHPDEDITRFLTRFAVPSNMTRNRGTLWPRSQLHHVPIREDVMSALAQLAEVRAEHDVAEHLIVYRGDEILLEWYDAIYDPIFISGAIDRRMLSAFSESVGGELEDV
jgi:hypothetical protein